MATIAEGLRAYLLADAAIATIVGQRCHHGRVPQASFTPWIWFQRRSRRAEALLGGEGEDVVESHFSIECVADDPHEAETLGDLVRERLNLHRGDMEGFTTLGVFVEDVDEEYFPESIDKDAGAHVVAWDVAVMHE